MKHPDRLIITPKIQNEIVGMLDFKVGSRKRTAHQGEFGMSVHPKYQRKGIGRMMLKALIEWAEAHPRIETLLINA